MGPGEEGKTDERLLEAKGLDGLRGRLDKYRDLGARFTKWHAVLRVGPDKPTPYCIATNAHALGRFAALSQEAGLVPIVEPEVLLDGDDSIDQCFEATEKTLREVFYELGQQGVSLEGMLLKPNMVLAGSDALRRATAKHVAVKTMEAKPSTLCRSSP